MAATTKLIVYNDTLRELGSHPLANTVSTNTRLQELEGAFPHAVEYILSRIDWNFARRRATLTGVADTSFTPFTYRYSRPSDYLRKIWVKSAANDEFQIDHTETGAVLYGYVAAPLMEYMSDHADNYDPANWPPQFTRCLVIYLAMLVGPKLARAVDANTQDLYGKLDMALADAERQEAVYAVNTQIATSRTPVIRRAIEMLGQQLAGSVAINSRIDELRWAMNKSFEDSVDYVLAQAAWNFASKRAVFTAGEEGDANIPTESLAGITEGYSLAPDSSVTPEIAISGFEYSYEMPSDFVHKVWIRSDVNSDYECHHQQLGGYMFTESDPCVMEYIASDDYTTDPANWPILFRETVASYLALTVAPELIIEDGGKRSKITAPQVRDRLQGVYAMKLSDAKIKDAIQQEPRTIPLGRFARARMGSIGTTSIRRYN